MAGRAGEKRVMVLSYTHARNDCEMCRERDVEAGMITAGPDLITARSMARRTTLIGRCAPARPLRSF